MIIENTNQLITASKSQRTFMKKIISLLTITVFLTVVGFTAQAQEAKPEKKVVKKTEQTKKGAKMEKKDCANCAEKSKCSDEKKMEEKKDDKK